jgi:hypothetical protein
MKSLGKDCRNAFTTMKISKKTKRHLTMCSPDPWESIRAIVVGLPLRGVRVFEQFVWLEVGSGKMALSRPAHQRVTPSRWALNK